MGRQEVRRGLTASADHIVAAEDTAAALGSGALPVLATPRLLAWLEAASCSAVDAALEDGSSSVGTRVTLEHLAASPVASKVTCSATVVQVDGRLLRFEVVATDDAGRVVAHGEITRVVVDEARFLGRATTG